MKKLLLSFSFLCSFCLMAQERNDYFKPHGGVSFTTKKEYLEQSVGKRNVSVDLDNWNIGLDARYKGIDLSFQYRFYSSIKTHFIYYGYFGYAIDENFYAKLGVFQVPFGALSPSNSWWYQLPYYLGLEDDNDIGVGLTYTPPNKKWKFDVAYFRQAEPNGPIDDDATDNAVGNGRYTYDVVPTVGIVGNEIVTSSIREQNQFNVRALYYPIKNVEIGGSLQLGGIYNSVLDKTDYALTSALHIDANFNHFGIKGELIHYDYKSRADNGQRLDVLQMAAYGFAQDVATKGTIYEFGLSYELPIKKGILTSIKPYVDYAYLDKSKSRFGDTQQLVPGCLITAGPVLLYIDYAMGKNHPAMTGEDTSGVGATGLGTGKRKAKWNKVLNINIGYFF